MTRPLIPWGERTLSALDARRDEACSRQLSEACAAGSIFGKGSLRTWREAYELSYLGRESRPAGEADAASVAGRDEDLGVAVGQDRVEQTVGQVIRWISVGPERESIIVRG